MEIKSKLIVLGLVENQNDKFLICQRCEPCLPEVHLKWDFPGGTNELGETLEDTLKREILEEAGLHIDIVHFLPRTISKVWNYSDHKQHTLVLCFCCRLLKGDLRLGDHKIRDLKWVSKKELADFDFIPTTKEFIDIAINNNYLG